MPKPYREITYITEVRVDAQNVDHCSIVCRFLSLENEDGWCELFKDFVGMEFKRCEKCVREVGV